MTSLLFFLSTVWLCLVVNCQPNDDASVMQTLKASLGDPDSLRWTDPDPCKWYRVRCDSGNRVVRIQIGSQNLKGTLPPELRNLVNLQRLEVQLNQLTGPVPSLSGLSSLQVLLLHHNNFSSFPSDFFTGMSGLQAVDIGDNPFSSWTIPDSLLDAASLQNFSADSANLSGKIPDFFGGIAFPGMVELHLASNNLEGELPASFAGSSIQSLWLNNRKINSRFNGSICVLENMTMLREVWLHGNHFTGPLPNFLKLNQLSSLSLRDNDLTGVVPTSLIELSSLRVVNLTNNLLQGPTPKFGPSVKVDEFGVNSFCLSDPGVECDSRISVLLSIVEKMSYPSVFANDWKGNDPCAGPWTGIMCSDEKNITSIIFQKMGLSGSISSNFSMLTSLQRIILSDNMLTGTIPTELTTLPNLTLLDVSNNRLHGKVPNFNNSNVMVRFDGNPDIVKDSGPIPSPPGIPTPSGGSSPGLPPGLGASQGGDSSGGGGKKSKTGVVVGAVVGAICGVFFIGSMGICLHKRKQKGFGRVQSPNTMVIHPRHSGNQHSEKITIAGSNANSGGSETNSLTSSGPSDIQVVEARNMVISIQVLRNVTNNFSEQNILGKGGFGTVYKGELHDGTKIAVKRMEAGVVSGKGLDEFKSEIAVLTKVRHRHLVSLLGYCLDGNERLLVYEYMPQGTLSRFLFNWKEEGLKPLEWTRRLSIALDVARGVEYLHGLAHHSFIHRDLKPSNILLGDDMRAKVADFGLVRLAPEGRGSIETRLAGTFGYLAPEYAETGRVTIKVDVFSFGVILMELMTGRKALDETQSEDSVHLVTWFRRMYVNKDIFQKSIDPTIVLNDETIANISTVAELAGHCTAREPYQRPDMGHAVNVLSSLVELWKPAEPDSDDIYGIDLDMTLPQALKKWQAIEGHSNVDESSLLFLANEGNSQSSIPPGPSGIVQSFASGDGR